MAFIIQILIVFIILKIQYIYEIWLIRLLKRKNPDGGVCDKLSLEIL